MAADEEPDQVVRAAALLAWRATPVDSDRGRARALGYLTRKGYTYEVAHEAIRAYERE
jgi:SOS response regulatory protein OraA/RecX